MRCAHQSIKETREAERGVSLFFFKMGLSCSDAFYVRFSTSRPCIICLFFSQFREREREKKVSFSHSRAHPRFILFFLSGIPDVNKPFIVIFNTHEGKRHFSFFHDRARWAFPGDRIGSWPV